MVTHSSSSMQPLCDNSQSSVFLEFKQSFLIDQHASDDPSAYRKVAAWICEGEEWAQSMKLVIDGKGKIGYLTGEVTKPAERDPKFKPWRREEAQRRVMLKDADQKHTTESESSTLASRRFEHEGDHG
ncbi:hypothetical protein CK203_080710 [Vitis vinifera]|uniref:Uncharacterized protein n=1 Tax=Vitis vinifera TaxID=29760 RepID=A0A438DZC6_VITVI|nr:hypothetical protein CK203_080710 [Vitis vinifera]